MRPRQEPFDATSDGAARPELGREHADTRAAAKLIDPIPKIYDSKPPFEVSNPGNHQLLRNTCVKLYVEGLVAGIGKSSTEAAAIKAI